MKKLLIILVLLLFTIALSTPCLADWQLEREWAEFERECQLDEIIEYEERQAEAEERQAEVMERQIELMEEQREKLPWE